MEVITVSNHNISLFSKVLVEAAGWLESLNQHMWNPVDLSVEALLKKYSMNEMKLCYEEDKLIGVFILQWRDLLFWPDIKEKESGFLHKLAVGREFGHRGYGKKLINSAELLCKNEKIHFIRLNCGVYRPRLRNFYESNGFKPVDEVFVDNRNQVRYVKNLNNGK